MILILPFNVANGSAMNSAGIEMRSLQSAHGVSQTKFRGLNYKKIRRQNLFWRMSRVEVFFNH
ncbi:MAG: hypothetical protein ACWA41_06205 [Putridiphycobacter sp.]